MTREFSIFRTLKALSKQRVATVLQPNNIWVIEKAMPMNEINEANLQTCLMRGWVEILHDNIPQGKLDPSMDLNKSINQESKTIYRLTDGGWNALHRTRQIGLLSIIIGLISLAIAVKAI